jgi:hypothetical protein
MKHLAALFLLVACAFAANPKEQLQKAKIVDVVKYDKGRIMYWTGMSPVFDRQPVYDITLQLDGRSYVVRYESIFGVYPESWKVGEEIQVKKERKRFVLINGDREIQANLVGKNACVPNPGYGTAVPVLPCP